MFYIEGGVTNIFLVLPIQTLFSAVLKGLQKILVTFKRIAASKRLRLADIDDRI